MTRKLSQASAIVLIGLTMILQSCASLPAYEGTVRRAAEVKLYIVEKTATDPATQSGSRKYVGNYEVKQEVKLSPEQQKAIKDMILAPELYVEEEVKSCLHQAAYAIEFRYKDKTDLTLVVSKSPCSKAYVTTKDGKEELTDLPVDNPLEDLLTQYAGGGK